MMEWNHLPVAGGLYDQHPKFLDDMAKIAQIDAAAQRRQAAEQQRRAKAKR